MAERFQRCRHDGEIQRRHQRLSKTLLSIPARSVQTTERSRGTALIAPFLIVKSSDERAVQILSRRPTRERIEKAGKIIFATWRPTLRSGHRPALEQLHRRGSSTQT